MAEAQLYLGDMYEKGQGAQKNVSTAKAFYGQACDNGNAQGCKDFARLDRKGGQIESR
ncbi:SEL1-like repeat protein [Actinobacillus seminis]|uniref:SEL1-like repeat protein n=1 Tax=Actinobacillus seminis TaxID=722 RepID=UPI003B95CFBF